MLRLKRVKSVRPPSGLHDGGGCTTSASRANHCVNVALSVSKTDVRVSKRNCIGVPRSLTPMWIPAFDGSLVWRAISE